MRRERGEGREGASVLKVALVVERSDSTTGERPQSLQSLPPPPPPPPSLRLHPLSHFAQLDLFFVHLRDEQRYQQGTLPSTPSPCSIDLRQCKVDRARVRVNS